MALIRNSTLWRKWRFFASDDLEPGGVIRREQVTLGWPSNRSGAGATRLFEGQVPARVGAARAGKRAEAAFDEGADLSDLAQGALARAGVFARRNLKPSPTFDRPRSPVQQKSRVCTRLE